MVYLGVKMNDLIKKFAGQAGLNLELQSLKVEKFAELIIRECAARATGAQNTCEEDIGGEVLKHFGVEE